MSPTNVLFQPQGTTQKLLGKGSALEFWESGELKIMMRKHKRTLESKCGGISTLNHGRYVRKALFSLNSSYYKNLSAKSLWK